MRHSKKALGMGFFLCWSLFGCQTREVERTRESAALSQAALLEKPLSELYPMRQATDTKLARIDLRETQRIQIHLDAKSKARPMHLVRYEGIWWLLRPRRKGEIEGRPFKHEAIGKLLEAFRKLKSARCEGINHKKNKKKDTEKPDPCLGFAGFEPQRAQSQLLFFGTQGRFLLQAMKTPHEKGGVHEGEWLIYQEARLYEQTAEGAIERHFGRIREAIRQEMRRDALWHPLVEELAWRDLGLAMRLGREIDAHLSRAKACFKQRRFPASVGHLSLTLQVMGTGKTRIVGGESQPHLRANAKLYWCIRWWLGQGKLTPFPLPSIQTKITIPAGG